MSGEGRVAPAQTTRRAPDSTIMMNFILGTMAGGLLVGLVTISAVRHPSVQAKLGLFPVSNALLMPAAKSPATNRLDPACRPLATVGQPDMLFSKRRFWFVAP
jgi:hypothetical protein